MARIGRASRPQAQTSSGPIIGPHEPAVVAYAPVATTVEVNLAADRFRRAASNRLATTTNLSPPTVVFPPPPFFGPQVNLLPVDRFGRRHRRHNLTSFLAPPAVVAITQPITTLTVAYASSIKAARRTFRTAIVTPPVTLGAPDEPSQRAQTVQSYPVWVRPRAIASKVSPPEVVEESLRPPDRRLKVAVSLAWRTRAEQQRRAGHSKLSPPTATTAAQAFYPGESRLVRNRPRAVVSKLSPPTTLQTFAAAPAHLARAIYPIAVSAQLFSPTVLQEFFGPVEEQVSVNTAAEHRRHGPHSKLSPPAVVRVPSVEQQEQTIRASLTKARPRPTLHDLLPPTTLSVFSGPRVSLTRTRPSHVIQRVQPPTVIRVPAVEQQQQTIKVATVRTRPAATQSLLRAPTVLQTFDGPSVSLVRTRPRPTSLLLSPPTVLQTFSGDLSATANTRPPATSSFLRAPTVVRVPAVEQQQQTVRVTIAHTRPRRTVSRLYAPAMLQTFSGTETACTVFDRRHRQPRSRLAPPAVVAQPAFQTNKPLTVLVRTRPRPVSGAVAAPLLIDGPPSQRDQTVRYTAPTFFQLPGVYSRLAPPVLAASQETPQPLVSLARTRPRNTASHLESPPVVAARPLAREIAVTLARIRPSRTTSTLFAPTAFHQAEQTIRIALTRTRPRTVASTLSPPEALQQFSGPPVRTPLQPSRRRAHSILAAPTVVAAVRAEVAPIVALARVTARQYISHLSPPSIVRTLGQKTQTIQTSLARTRPRPTVALVAPPAPARPVSLREQTATVSLTRTRPPQKRALLSPPTVSAALPTLGQQTIIVSLAVQARLLLPRTRYKLRQPVVLVIVTPGVTWGEDVSATAVEEYDIAGSAASDEQQIAATSVQSDDTAAVESTITDVAATSVESQDKEAGT